MDGVKRYYVQLFKLGGDEQRYAHGALGAVEIVRSSDYDAALAREAALREELAGYKRGARVEADAADEARKALAAAEQRNAEWRKLLVRMHQADALSHNCGLWKDIDAALKPTESGAIDKCASDGGTCGLGGHCGECPHVESGASE